MSPNNNSSNKKKKKSNCKTRGKSSKKAQQQNKKHKKTTTGKALTCTDNQDKSSTSYTKGKATTSKVKTKSAIPNLLEKSSLPSTSTTPIRSTSITPIKSTSTTPITPSTATTPITPSTATTPITPSTATTPIKPSTSSTTPIKPSTSTTPIKPSTSNTPVKPSTFNTPVKPSTSSHELEKPPISYELKKPLISYELKKPPTSYELEKSSTFGELRKPSTSDELEKPSTSYVLEKPSTSYVLEKPSTSNSPEKFSAEGEFVLTKKKNRKKRKEKTKRFHQQQPSTHVVSPSRNVRSSNRTQHSFPQPGPSHTGAIPKSTYYHQPSSSANLNVNLPMFCPQPIRYPHPQESIQLSSINQSLRNLQISEAHSSGTQSRRELLLSGQPLQISHLLTHDGMGYQQQFQENRPLPYSQVVARGRSDNQQIPQAMGPNYANLGYYHQPVYVQQPGMVPPTAYVRHQQPHVPYMLYPPSNIPNFQTREQINSRSPIAANRHRHYATRQLRQLEPHQVAINRNIYDTIADSYNNQPRERENRNVGVNISQLSVSENHPPLMRYDYNLHPLGDEFLQRHEAADQRMLEREEMERQQSDDSTRYRIRTHLFHSSNDSLLVPLRSSSFDSIFNYFHSNNFNISSELISRSCPPWFYSLAFTTDELDNHKIITNETTTTFVRKVTKIHNRAKQLTKTPLQYGRHIQPQSLEGNYQKKQISLDYDSDDGNSWNSDFDDYPFGTTSSDSEESLRLNITNTPDRFYAPLFENKTFFNIPRPEMIRLPGYQCQPRFWNYQNVSRPPAHLHPYEFNDCYSRNLRHSTPDVSHQQSTAIQCQAHPTNVINTQTIEYITDIEVRKYISEGVTISTDNEFVDAIYGPRENSPRRHISPKKYLKSPRKRLQCIDESPPPLELPESPTTLVNPETKLVNFSTSLNDFTAFIKPDNDIGLSQSWSSSEENTIAQENNLPDIIVTPIVEDYEPLTVLPPWSISLPTSADSPLVCRASCSITTSTSNVWKPMSTMEIKSIWQSKSCSSSVENSPQKRNPHNKSTKEGNASSKVSDKSTESVNYWQPLPDCQKSPDFLPPDYPPQFHNYFDESFPRKRIITDTWQPLLTQEEEAAYKKYLADNANKPTTKVFYSSEDENSNSDLDNKYSMCESPVAGPSNNEMYIKTTSSQYSSIKRWFGTDKHSKKKKHTNRTPSIEDTTEFPIDTWDSDEKTKNDTDSDF